MIRLIVGDALEVMRAQPTQGIAVVATAPPYASGAFSEAQRQAGMAQGVTAAAGECFQGDGMGTAGLVWMLRALAFEAARCLRPGGWFLCFADWRQVPSIAPAIESAGLRWRQMVVWDKGAPGMGIGIRPQHEIILAFTSSGAPDILDPALGNVIRISRVKQKRHPTEKPIELMRTLLRATAPPGSTIIDPFCGSGTTLVAAAQLGLDAIGVDRAAEYVRTAAERLRDEADTIAEATIEARPASQPTLFAETIP